MQFTMHEALGKLHTVDPKQQRNVIYEWVKQDKINPKTMVILVSYTLKVNERLN